MGNSNNFISRLSDYIIRRKRTSIVLIGASTLVFFFAFVFTVTLSYKTQNITKVYQLSQSSLNLHEDLSIYANELVDAKNQDNPDLSINLYKDRIEVLVDKLSDYVVIISDNEGYLKYSTKSKQVLDNTYNNTFDFYSELIDETNELIKRPTNSYARRFIEDYLEERKVTFHVVNRQFLLTNKYLSNELSRLNRLQDISNFFIIFVLLITTSLIIMLFISLTRRNDQTARKLNFQARKTSIVTRESQMSVAKFFIANDGREYFEVDSVATNILGIERDDLKYINNSVALSCYLFIKKYANSDSDIFKNISKQIDDNEIIRIHVPLTKKYGNKLVEFSFFKQDHEDETLYALIKGQSTKNTSTINFDFDNVDLPRYGYWKVDLFKEKRLCYMDLQVARMNGVSINDSSLYSLEERRESILKANGEMRYNEIFDNYLKLEFNEIDKLDHEYRLIDYQGNPIFIKEHVKIIRNDDNQPIYMVGLMSDITEQKEFLQEINYLAYYDEVTGYRNRFALNKDYPEKLKDGYGILLKLDNYTDVIKFCGYENADEFTRMMMAQSFMGSSKVVSKYVLTYNTFFYYTNLPLDDVEQTVRSMLKKINKQHSIGNKMIDLRFKAVILEDQHDSLDQLLKEIEYTYNVCHELDRNLVISDENILIEYRAQKHFEELIRKAITNKEFFPHFQPKANISTNKLIGAEALARWELDSEIVLPHEFIPYLEHSGLISALDLMIMRKALVQTKEWIDTGIVDENFRISFNLSITTVENNDLTTIIKKVVDEIGIRYQNIEIEVTETMVVTDSKKVLGELIALKELGATISIDDFSAGNSSLVSICKFPCDIIKIDSKLLWSIEASPINKEVISLVSALGKRIEKRIICEGVETIAQRDVLEREGVEFAQGYYFAKPLSVKDFEIFSKK